LAVDPGRTTGLCQAEIKDGTSVMLPYQKSLEVHNFYELLEKLNPMVLIIEKFEFRKKSQEGLDLFPRELIGVARLWSVTHHSEWYEQSASYGMGYFNDKILKDSKVYVPGIPHAMDATRHFLHWFTFGPGFKHNTTGGRYPFKLITEAA